jgi:hypothetical protein
MSELEASSLFDPTLPERFASVLDALSELDELRQASSLSKDERRARASILHERLLGDVTGLEEGTPPEHRRDAPAFRRWFSEAVLLWVRFARTGSTPLVDSVGSETLAAFPVDLPIDDGVAERVKEALGRAFAWSEEELATLERRVEHATSNLELKRKLTSALVAELRQRDGLGSEGRLALMREFYGPLGFRAGDVDLLIVSTQIFFFLPRKGNSLEVPDWPSRPASEQREVRAFFAKLDRSNNALTRRFPAFGLYEPEAMSEELVARLAAATGVAPEVVEATLATMFSVIPRSLHSQYLVHDLWGHTWQEALSEFEWEYALLPKLDRPLSATDGPDFGGPDAPMLGSAFVAVDGRTTLDIERLIAFGEADLRGRIQVATSVPLSEVLADFMESKFSRACPALELPTSSLIRSTSLKADLTIGDTRTQVRRYTAPYRKLSLDAEARARLAAELLALGLPEPGLDAAVREAGRRLWLRFAPAFDDGLAPEPAEAEGEIRSSVMRRLLLQLVLVMADLERALDRVRAGGALEAWRDPLASADLFAVVCTHFYEQDRQKNFWHLDQLARNEYAAACEQLKHALAG